MLKVISYFFSFQFLRFLACSNRFIYLWYRLALCEDFMPDYSLVGISFDVMQKITTKNALDVVSEHHSGACGLGSSSQRAHV